MHPLSLLLTLLGVEAIRSILLPAPAWAGFAATAGWYLNGRKVLLGIGTRVGNLLDELDPARVALEMADEERAGVKAQMRDVRYGEQEGR